MPEQPPDQQSSVPQISVTNELLRDILAVLKQQSVALLNLEEIANANLTIAIQSKGILEDISDALLLPDTEHVFTIVVRPLNLLTNKNIEGITNMSVEAGKPRAFGAQMQDNGNVIDLTEGEVFSWSTDDSTDTIDVRGNQNEIASVTTTDPPSSGRNAVTVTATATDPDGNTQTGSVMVPIIPGVGHTFTISVAELAVNPLPGRKRK